MEIRSLTEIRNKHCKECILHKTAEYVCLTGYGKVPSDIMIIGEAPSHREDDSGKPFVGKIGKILDIILESIGITRDDIYITNVVHCRPPDNRTPKMDEMKACREFLLEEIRTIQPTTIIVLGNIALKGLYKSNLMSISRERGKVLQFRYQNKKGIKIVSKVIPTYHPGAAARNKYYANIIYEDIVNGLNRKAAIDVREKEEYKLVSKNNREEVYNRLYKANTITLDVETTGLDFMDKMKELVCVGMSDGPGRGFIWPLTDNNIERWKKILSNKELVINHNIKFDLEWLWRYGIHCKAKVFDTLIAKHLLDENCPDKDLKTLARVEEGMQDLSNAERIMAKHRKEETKPTWEEWVRYNGGDVDAPFRLFNRYKPLLEKEELSDLMHREMKILKTLVRIETFGFQIDKEIHSRLTVEYEQRIHQQYTNVRKLVGDINLSSTPQLAELLYENLGLPVLHRTDNKEPSTSEDTLLELLELSNIEKFKRQVLKEIMSHRKLSKLYNTYLIGIIKKNQLAWDNKLHCNFKLAGTKTGRLSCAEPNLQNIPREGDIKEMFISSFKNGVIIKCDYSQVELRLLAHYANDKRLIRAFKEGRDIHRETTAKCLHKPYEKVTEEERKIIGKRVNFGIIYQISAGGLGSKIGCTTNKAQSYIDNWFHEFYQSREWMDFKRQEIIKTGRSRSFTGRIRRFYGVDPSTSEGREAIRQGINSPIQGGAGDITKYNMWRLDMKLKKEGFKSRVICNVHDEIDIDTHPEEVKDVIKLARPLLVEPPIPLRVPLEVEIMVGKNWSKSAMQEVK